MPRLISFLRAAIVVLLALGLAGAQSPQSAATASQQTTDSSRKNAAAEAGSNPQVNRSAAVLIFVRSDTVYMKSATMRSWLQRQPEFSQLNLAFAADQGHADYYLEITRPTFTWDWTYCVVKTETGKVVASGKVTAATAENAAKALAPKVIQSFYSETSVSPVEADSSRKKIANEILPKRFVPRKELALKFESAKTVSVRSLTVWFNEDDLAKALNQRPEFSAWGYELVTPGKYQPSSGKYVEIGPLPDFTVEVNRPLFTWDWTFSILDRKAQKSLASGKLTAISGPAAAPKLAQAVIGVIAGARGLPASMQRQFDQALAESKVRTWDVRHVSGQNYLKSGQKVQLAVGEKTVFARDRDEILFSVPMEDLLQFSHTSNVRDRSLKWFEGWEKAGNFVGSDIGDDPRAAMGALMILLPMLAIEHGGGALLKGSATADHFLILHWKDVSGITVTTLQSDERTIFEICAELDKFSKSTAVDLDAAAQKLSTDLDQRLQSTNYFIETDRDVTIDNGALPAGRYRLVILPREKSLAEVYFLRDPDNAVAARTMVQDVSRSGADRSPRVSYGLVSGLHTLEEIQIDEHSLRFSPMPVFPEEVPARHEDD